MAAAETRLIPTTLTFITCAHCSSVTSSTEPTAEIPALFATMSITETNLYISSKAFLTLSVLPTSQLIHVPESPNSPAFKSKPNTLAPKEFNCWHNSKPIPDPEPVTTTFNPAKSDLNFYLSNRCRWEKGTLEYFQQTFRHRLREQLELSNNHF